MKPAVTNDTNKKVVNGVKGDPNYGDDSDLYDAMGYGVQERTGERPFTESVRRASRSEENAVKAFHSSAAGMVNPFRRFVFTRSRSCQEFRAFRVFRG
jgi:hypothetical protein